MKTTIYFIRHGQVHNPNNIFYGRIPRFGLTKKGEKQIEQTGEFLQKQNIDLLYASPLLRARQTARFIQKKLNLPVHYSKLLLEIYTSVQGTSWAELERINFDYFPSKENNVRGETLNEIANRMEKFLLQMEKKHPGKKVAAVGHGDPITMIKALHHNLHENLKQFRSIPGPYIAHGEVLETVVENGKLLSVKTIYKPAVT